MQAYSLLQASDVTGGNASVVFNVECYVVATPIGVLLRYPRVREAVRRAPPVDIEPHRHTTPKWVVHRVCCTHIYKRVQPNMSVSLYVRRQRLCATPFGVERYMCVAGSGGGTRYARLPPVIEVIPHSGYSSLNTDVSHYLTLSVWGMTRIDYSLVAHHTPMKHLFSYILHRPLISHSVALQGSRRRGQSCYRLKC